MSSRFTEFYQNKRKRRTKNLTDCNDSSGYEHKQSNIETFNLKKKTSRKTLKEETVHNSRIKQPDQKTLKEKKVPNSKIKQPGKKTLKEETVPNSNVKSPSPKTLKEEKISYSKIKQSSPKTGKKEPVSNTSFSKKHLISSESQFSSLKKNKNLKTSHSHYRNKLKSELNSTKELPTKESSKITDSSKRCISKRQPKDLLFEFKNGKGKGKKKSTKGHRRKIKDMASSEDDSYFSQHPIFGNRNRSQTNHQNNHKKCSTHLPMEEDSKVNGDTTTVPELPGFYYDREKKKYFKILPDNSCIGNAVTHAGIKIKTKEETRKTDLLTPLESRFRTQSHHGKSWQPLHSYFLPCMTCHYQQGLISKREMKNSLDNLRIRDICTKPQEKIKINSNNGLVLDRQLEMIENKRIVGVFSLKESMIQRILWLKLSEKPRTRLQDRLSLLVDSSPSGGYYQSAVKISSMRLIDTDSVLYTGMVYTGTPESLVFIKGIGEGSSRYEVYSIGQKATWTCAWNKHANQFSVGSEKCGFLLDVQTRRLWEINTNNSDVLCQVFSKQNGNYLYSGTRKNQIFTHDLRSISTYCVNHLAMSSSVCGLQLLQNDVHLLASDVKGKVKLWDLRTKKVVTEYLGLKNEYLKIPIQIDHSEEVVYGVDQDGYTRLWCLQTGELLKKIPPPMATSYDFFPSVLYSKNWMDISGNAGLLMGLGDKIYVYSDYQEDS